MKKILLALCIMTTVLMCTAIIATTQVLTNSRQSQPSERTLPWGTCTPPPVCKPVMVWLVKAFPVVGSDGVRTVETPCDFVEDHFECTVLFPDNQTLYAPWIATREEYSEECYRYWYEHPFNGTLVTINDEPVHVYYDDTDYYNYDVSLIP